MSEIARVNGLEHEVTDIEKIGLARIALAVSSNNTLGYLRGYSKVHKLARFLHSVKVPNGARLIGEHTRNVSCYELATKVTANSVVDCWIDTNFSNDGNQLISSIDAINGGSERVVNDQCLIGGSARERFSGVLPPAYLSVQVTNLTDVEELRVAVEHVEIGKKIIAMVDSSKRSERSHHYYGDPDTMAIAGARLAMDAGITNLSVSAVRAAKVREALESLQHPFYDELTIYGSGLAFKNDPRGEHDEILDVTEFRSNGIDIGILGGVVLLDDHADSKLVSYGGVIGAQYAYQ